MKLRNWAVPALAILWALPASANQMPDWKVELAQYQADIETRSNGTLWVRHAAYSLASMTTCASSVALTAATFVAETMPIVNGISEVVGNTVDEKYQTKTYESLLSWEALGQFGRGTVGGGVIAVAETLEFVTLWLAGNEEASYAAVKKMYASSMATAESLFASQGKCLMQISKVALTRKELQKRGAMSVENPSLAIGAP